MKKNLKRIASGLIALNMLVFLFACTPTGENTGKDDNLSQAQVNTASTNANNNDTSGNGDSNTVSPTDNTDYEVPEFSENAFASKIAGTYFGMDEGDMPFYLSIYNFCGNVYAYGGYTAEEDEEEVYSFWAMEIVPEDPRDFYYENTDECRVGVTACSVMSNMCRYWSAPVTGSIKLTNDGITVTGDGDLCPLYTNGKTIDLKRRDDLRDFFEDETAVDVADGFYAENSDENLYGIWKLKDTEEPWFVSFEKGERYSEITVIQKIDGLEVTLLKGFFETDDSNNGRAWMKYFMSGSPEIFNFEYRYEGDDLVFDNMSSGFPFCENDAKESVLEKVGINDVPIAMLVEPDNLDAVKGTLAVNIGGETRDVTPFFKDCNDVENNGTNFVRVGNLVFFRYYDPSGYNDHPIYADWGDFNNHYDFDKIGCVCFYDLRTGETGLAYRDYSGGALYYMNGKFYTERFESNDYYSVNYIVACYPDGSALEEKSDTNTHSVIEAVSDNNDAIAVDQFLAGQFYIDYGNEYRSTLQLKDQDYVLAAEFADDYIYVVTTGYNDDAIRLTEYQKFYGEVGIQLAEYDAKDIWKNGIPRVYQIFVTEDEVYMGINAYEDSELKKCVVVEAERNKEDSGKVIYEGMPDNIWAFDRPYSSPYFYFNYADEIFFAQHNVNGEMALSEGIFGDLIYYDSPYSADLIVPDFMEDSVEGIYEGMSTIILQDGQRIKDKYFVITANATYDANKSIGNIRSFELNDIIYTVYDSDKNAIRLEPAL